MAAADYRSQRSVSFAQVKTGMRVTVYEFVEGRKAERDPGHYPVRDGRKKKVMCSGVVLEKTDHDFRLRPNVKILKQDMDAQAVEVRSAD